MSEERRLRIGLAGCGGIARQYHLRELQADPRVDVVAVAEPAAQAREAIPPAEGTDVLADAGELIGRADIDAVIVCTPNAAHAPIGEAVLTAGQNLYLEKPVALSLDEARRLEALADGGRALAVVGFQYRLSPVFRRLREALRSGAIGEVRHLRAWHSEAVETVTMPAWKRSRSSGGGALLDVGSHEIDLARWLLDSEVAEVETASLSSVRSEHDEARLRLRMESGATVDVLASYLQGRKHRLEAEGAGGVLRAERWPARLSRPRRAAPGGPSRLATALRAIPIPRREPSFGLALGGFVVGALGEAHTLPSLGDGRRSLEVVLAAERAAGE